MICEVVHHYHWKALPLDFQAAFQSVIRHAFWPDYQLVIRSVILVISAGNEKEHSDVPASGTSTILRLTRLDFKGWQAGAGA